MTQNSSPTRPCPVCQTPMVLKRQPLHTLLGVVIVVICGLLAVPTLGVSLIFMLWGIFLLEARPQCPSCGHRPKRRRR